MQSRAVLIKVLDGLTSDNLSNATWRRITIWGSIRSIKYDNETNFVGTSNKLKQEAWKTNYSQIIFEWTELWFYVQAFSS